MIKTYRIDTPEQLRELYTLARHRGAELSDDANSYARVWAMMRKHAPQADEIRVLLECRWEKRRHTCSVYRLYGGERVPLVDNLHYMTGSAWAKEHLREVDKNG